MTNAFFTLPKAVNEPVLSYAPGSPEKSALKAMLSSLKHDKVEIPMTIGGLKVETGDLHGIHPPHEIHHTLGQYHRGNAAHVTNAIQAALQAKPDWGKDALA